MDEERGLVMMASIADFGLAQRQYTLTDGRKVESDRYHAMSRELFEVYKVVGGRIEAIEAVSAWTSPTACQYSGLVNGQAARRDGLI